MAPDWLRFLTTVLGLAASVGFYGAPTKALVPPVEVAAVSLQREMAAETDSSGDSGTDDSGGDEGSSEGSEEDGD